MITTDNPIFSVVVPVYNKELQIVHSLGSVLNQSFANFELLIVCDPSTDNSNSEVAKVKDPRIRTFHRDIPGPGGYAARNVGIKEARSDWIAFLDADDEWRSDHLELAFDYIANNQNLNVISFSYSVLGSSSKRSGLRRIVDENKILSQQMVLQLLEKKDIFHTNAMIIKRQSLIAAGCFPDGSTYRRGGDYDTWLRVLMDQDYLFFSSEVTSAYNFNNSGVISDPRNIECDQPVVDTVKRYLNSKRFNESSVSRSLMRLSNRKEISLLTERKKYGIDGLSFNKVYISQLNVKQTLRLLALMLPNRFYTKIIPLLRLQG